LQPVDITVDIIQEITDFIITSVYQYMFDERSSDAFVFEETQAKDRIFNEKLLILSQVVIPADFDIPSELMNS